MCFSYEQIIYINTKTIIFPTARITAHKRFIASYINYARFKCFNILITADYPMVITPLISLINK